MPKQPSDCPTLRPSDCPTVQLAAMMLNDHQGTHAQHTHMETWNKLMNHGRRGPEEIKQRSYMHTIGLVHGFVH